MTRASQYIRRTRAADFGPSLSMFKKAADIEVSYKTMYVCTAAEIFFVTSWIWPCLLFIYNMNSITVNLTLFGFGLWVFQKQIHMGWFGVDPCG